MALGRHQDQVQQDRLRQVPRYRPAPAVHGRHGGGRRWRRGQGGEASKKGVEALMVHYDLSTQEGIMLMCLAEALLRIPDKETENLLIRDKLTSATWQGHLGQAESSFVNMATWGLALTGKILHKNKKASFKR